jgi:hypothetical protein
MMAISNNWQVICFDLLQASLPVVLSSSPCECPVQGPKQQRQQCWEEATWQHWWQGLLLLVQPLVATGLLLALLPQPLSSDQPASRAVAFID